MLRQVGERVEIHDAHFPSGTPDEVWLQEIGRRGWVVLTKDANIRYHPLEKQAIQASGVVAVILTKGNLKAEEMGKVFVRALPQIKRLIRKNRCAFKILAQQLVKGMGRTVPVQNFPGPIIEHRLHALNLGA